MNQVEQEWQETKAKISEEIKLIEFEIAKIEDNIYGDTSKVCAEKLQIQKGRLVSLANLSLNSAFQFNLNVHLFSSY